MERIGQYELGKTEHTGRSREVPWGRRTWEQGGFPGRSGSTKVWVLYRSSWGGLVSSPKEQGGHQGGWDFGNYWWMRKSMLRAFLRTKADTRWACGLFKCWILPSAQCLVFSQFIWKQDLKILELVEPFPRRWGLHRETREGGSEVLMWEFHSPTFKGHSRQCYEIQQFLLE